MHLLLSLLAFYLDLADLQPGKTEQFCQCLGRYGLEFILSYPFGGLGCIFAYWRPRAGRSYHSGPPSSNLFPSFYPNFTLLNIVTPHFRVEPKLLRKGLNIVLIVVLSVVSGSSLLFGPLFGLISALMIGLLFGLIFGLDAFAKSAAATSSSIGC